MAKPNCTEGYPCGNTCISNKYTCEDMLTRLVASGLIRSAIAHLDEPDSEMVLSGRGASLRIEKGSFDRSLTNEQLAYELVSMEDKLELLMQSQGATNGLKNPIDYATLSLDEDSNTVRHKANLKVEQIVDLSSGETMLSNLAESFGPPTLFVKKRGVTLEAAKAAAEAAKVELDKQVQATGLGEGLFVDITDIKKTVKGAIVTTGYEVEVGSYSGEYAVLIAKPDKTVVASLAEQLDLRNLKSFDQVTAAGALAPAQWEAKQQKNYEAEDLFAERLGELGDKAFNRKPNSSAAELEAKYQTAAKQWALSKGFTPGGVNGFSAEATAAHDISHPATFELTGMSSADIHKTFGNLKTQNGKDSLLAEEAMVNMVEHLSRGDGLANSLVNAIRLTKVLSRSGTEDEIKYAHSSEFSDKLTSVLLDSVIQADNYTPIMAVVRKYNRISKTAEASGSDFSGSASGG